MTTVAILGTGLMGSSLGLALKQRGVPVRVRAYARREETREVLAERGAADAVFSDPAEAVDGADLIVFCVPVLQIPALAEACRPGLNPGAVLTDVGSTKAFLNDRMHDVLDGMDAEFIGSHPICGSEQQGVQSGDPQLYEGAVTVVTPADAVKQSTVEEVSTLWKTAGSRVVVMDPQEHDRILAVTSHLPHVAAAALALSSGLNGPLCGSGFRDTTRIAEGSPEVWADVAKTNGPALNKALKEYCENIAEFAALIDEADRDKLVAWFASARDKRRELLD